MNAPAPPPAAARAMLRDFPDALPAMIVKELRQGLRTRMMLVPFLVLVAFLTVSVIALLDSASQSGAPHVLFWFPLMLCLVYVLPLRNLAALSHERQFRTLETLMLTRLTAWRIVFGKWCATMALSVLVAVTVLPLLMVRYLAAGTDLSAELEALLQLLLLGGVSAAAFTSASGIHHGMMRTMVAFAIGVAGYIWIVKPDLSFPPNDTDLVRLAVSTFWWAWVIVMCLLIAASGIAPEAKDYTFQRRLLFLVMVVVCAGAAVFLELDPVTTRIRSVALHLILSPPTAHVHAASLASAGPFVLLAACAMEMTRSIPPDGIYENRFAVRGALGRFAALFFHPGWFTGVWFCFALWGLWAVGRGFSVSVDFRSLFPSHGLPLKVAGAAFFSVVVLRTFLKPFRHSAVAYATIFIAGMFTALLLMRLTNSILVAGWLPLLLVRGGVEGAGAAQFQFFLYGGLAMLFAMRPTVELLRRLRAAKS